MNLSPNPLPAPVGAARVVLLPAGPYEVTGPPVIAHPDGEPIDPPAPKVYLGRCGGPANKPFCDGSHARNGWKDES